MPVREISENCFQIRRFNCMNCYLVREADGLTLVDTALGAARVIVEASRQLQQPIRRILLTHSHLDHVGSVDALDRILPGLEVTIGSRESALLAEASRGVKNSQMKLLPGEARMPVKGSFKKVRHAPIKLVNEGEKIGSLRAIATPGHTPGHLSFIDERDGAIYAGDAFTTFGELRLPFDPVAWFPFPRGGTWHFETALASGERLRDVNGRRILAGHGPALDISKNTIQEAIEHGRRRLGVQPGSSETRRE